MYIYEIIIFFCQIRAGAPQELLGWRLCPLVHTNTRGTFPVTGTVTWGHSGFSIHKSISSFISSWLMGSELIQRSSCCHEGCIGGGEGDTLGLECQQLPGASLPSPMTQVGSLDVAWWDA